MMNEKEEQLSNYFDEYTQERQTRRVPLKQVDLFLQQVEIKKTILMNEITKQFGVQKKILQFWVQSYDDISLIELQLYEDLYEGIKKEEQQEDIQFIIQKTNEELNKNQFKQIEKEKLNIILNTQIDQDQPFLITYKEFEEDNENQEFYSKKGVEEIIDKYLQKNTDLEVDEFPKVQSMNFCLNLGEENWENMANLKTVLSTKGQNYRKQIEKLKQEEIIEQDEEVTLDNPEDLEEQIDNLTENQEYTVETKTIGDQEIIISLKSQESKIEIIEIIEKLEEAFLTITDVEKDIFDFAASLSLSRESIMKNEKLLESILEGFSLSLKLDVSNFVWKNIRKNIQKKIDKQQKYLFALLQNSNVKLNFKSIANIQKFLYKFKLHKKIQKTPKISDFFDDLTTLFSTNSEFPFKAILPKIFSSQNVSKLSFHALCGQTMLGVEIRGKNLQNLSSEPEEQN